MVNVIPLFSAIVSMIGAILLVRMYSKNKYIVAIIFALQLADMFIGQLLEFLASSIGWTTVSYKIYYLSSPLSAGILAVGVAYAANKYRLGKYLGIYIVILTFILGVRLALATVNVEALETYREFVGGKALEESIRILSPPITIPSGIIILGISILQAFRGKIKEYRYGWIGILLGNLVFMVAGGLLRRGYAEAFLVGELIATIILAGSFIRLGKKVVEKPQEKTGGR